MHQQAEESLSSSKILDYLIVGQGIAGSLIGWFLQKTDQRFLIIDNGHRSASSKIAAGIINPITGRRFVKSWMIDVLLPFAKSTYKDIERKLGISLWQEIDIIRFFSSIAEENNWLSKTMQPEYEKYLNKAAKTKELDPFIFNTASCGIVKGAKMDLGKLIAAFQKYFMEKGCLSLENIDYQQIKIKAGHVCYKNHRAKKIIFCEGHLAFQNPWFQHLPFESAKGEVLILKIPGFQANNIIKKQCFLVPLGKELFWFGSNYEWENLSPQPTSAGKEYLIKQLEGILKANYEVIEHLAAVRPVLKDRRPAIGLHPNSPEIAIFNGLGTKGTSIAPYWAKQLVDFLTNKIELEAEANVQRFPL